MNMFAKSRWLFVLPFLAAACGYLLSKASWVGRTGINLVYRQYSFLNVWWKAALAVLAVWLLLYGVQRLPPLRTRDRAVKIFYSVAALLCLSGWVFAYLDFQNTASHRWLGGRFHTGVYLFFAGWLLILVQGWLRYKKRKKAS